jgi:hypothetical protein
MATQQAMDGTWIRRLGGKLFLTNFSGEDFVFVDEFPEGTGLTKGHFTIDATTEPAADYAFVHGRHRQKRRPPARQGGRCRRDRHRASRSQHAGLFRASAG